METVAAEIMGLAEASDDKVVTIATAAGVVRASAAPGERGIFDHSRSNAGGARGCADASAAEGLGARVMAKLQEDFCPVAFKYVRQWTEGLNTKYQKYRRPEQ